MDRLLILVLMVGVAGCAAGREAQSQSTQQASSSRHFAQMGDNPDPRDPAPVAQSVICLEIYQLAVPAGAVSGNEEFWKQVNEQVVDVATYDILYKNGIRVGEASNDQWPFFKDFIEKNPALVRHSTMMAREANSIELEMNKGLPFQNLFYFNADNLLQGRSFDRSDNLLTVSFQPAPRKADTLRVALCPVVRTERKILQYSVNNDEREIQYVHPERLYDLNLRADVAMDHFLLIAPSPEGRWPTSIGNAFLMRDAPAERLEQLILLIPRMVPMEQTISSTAQP
ncbi:MAG: hypothetical protein IT446_09695 [Phycisphaerales bacterium]|nr:hypothetical protein [Phycisphaerales bacterium]